MKKLLFSAIAALAIANVVQAAESTNFGVMKVPSNAKQTIVSVPWLASGAESNNVRVADLVLTAGLTPGDELKYYNNNNKSYQVWRLVENQGVKSWEAAQNLNDAGQKISNPTADVATLTRGQAIILKRTGNDLSGGFYIMGKPAALSAEEKTLNLVAGSLNNPVFTLVAPPLTQDVSVNSLTWTGMTPGLDKLIVNGTGDAIVTLTWKNDTKKWSKDATLSMGFGAWFKSEGTGSKSVTWQN